MAAARLRDLPLSVLTKIVLMLYCDEDSSHKCLRVSEVLYREEAFFLFLADPRLYSRVMESSIVRKTAYWAYGSHWEHMIEQDNRDRHSLYHGIHE